MNVSLPDWLERALGFPSDAGEGTVCRLDHAWLWPPWATLLGAVAMVAFVAWNYSRESRQTRPALRRVLTGLRIAVLVLVAVMAAQFALLLQRTGLPNLVVLIDDTPSMSIADRYDEDSRKRFEAEAKAAGFASASRWDLARTILCRREGEALARIADDYRLRLYYVTGVRAAEAGDPAALAEALRAASTTGTQTRLGAAVSGVLDDLRGSSPAAIVVLSDGINTDGPTLSDAAAACQRKGVPLFFVGIGDDRPVRDLKLSDLLVDDVVFLDDMVFFEAKVSGVGYAGRKVAVSLRRDGKPDVLGKSVVEPPADARSVSVRIPFRPTEEGEFRFVVEIEPQKGELQTDNNRQSKVVRVRKEKIRVLLVESEPNYEYRYLRNMLGRERTIELKTVLHSADVEHAQQDKAVLRSFPVRREELFQYDVVVLGDVNPTTLGPAILANLTEFVDQRGKGGALICLAGPKFMPGAYRNTPLARLLPMDMASVRTPPAESALGEPFSVIPTELGLACPAFQLGDSPEQSDAIWKRLPGLTWAIDILEVKQGARVLAERIARDGGRRPIVVMQYVGAGKVWFHATDETWRWRRRVGDIYFGRYWVQLIRYLARSKLGENEAGISLSVDRREYRRGEPVLVRLRFADERQAPDADDGVTVLVERAGQTAQRVALRRAGAARGLFEAVVGDLAAGAYRARLIVPTTPGNAPAIDFTVLMPAGEFERVQMDAPAMRRAAEVTKGRFADFADADRLWDQLPPGQQVPVESLPSRPLWNTWPLLLAVLSLLIAEWLLRKAGGMA